MNGQGLSADKRWYCHLIKVDQGNVLEIERSGPGGKFLGAWARVRVANLSNRPNKQIEVLIECLQDLLKNRGGKCTKDSNDRAVQMMRQLAFAENTIRHIDMTLRVPAAEYVPAIQDVFKIIDQWKAANDDLVPPPQMPDDLA